MDPLGIPLATKTAMRQTVSLSKIVEVARVKVILPLFMVLVLSDQATKLYQKEDGES